jgi:hypothetical protein
MDIGRARVYLGLLGINVVLAGAATLMLRSYYARYHFGVGPRYGALMIGFPVAIVLGVVVGFGALAIARRAGTRASVALGIATLAIVLVLAIALGMEWWRTTDQRKADVVALAAAAPNTPLQQTKPRCIL